MGRHKAVKNTLSPFEFFKHLTEHKTPWDKFTLEQKKSFNVYILNRVISMGINEIDIVNEVNTQQVPDRFVYELYLKILPHRRMFNRYIKSTSDKPKDALLNQIAEYFECSKREVLEFFDILEIDHIESILRKHGLIEKEIEQLMN